MRLPGRRSWAESDDVVRRRTGECTGFVIVSIAVSARARTLKHRRVCARPTSIRRRVLAAATILGITERLAGALARHACSSSAAATRAHSVHHLQLRRTRIIEVGYAPRVRTISAGPALWDHQHRQIVTVHETDVIEIEPICAIQRELRQSSWWHGPTAATLDGSGAAVSGYAGEFPGGGVLGTECPAPNAARPRGRDRNGNWVAGIESKSGGWKWLGPSAW